MKMIFSHHLNKSEGKGKRTVLSFRREEITKQNKVKKNLFLLLNIAITLEIFKDQQEGKDFLIKTFSFF